MHNIICQQEYFIASLKEAFISRYISCSFIHSLFGLGQRILQTRGVVLQPQRDVVGDGCAGSQVVAGDVEKERFHRALHQINRLGLIISLISKR